MREMDLKDVVLLYRLFEVIAGKFTKKNKDKKKRPVITQSIENIEEFIVSKTVFKKTTKELFRIMKKHEFHKSSSVDSVYDIHWKNKYDRSSFSMLGEINLYSHTIDVMLETIFKYEDKLPERNLSTLLLIAQLHDFGKNYQISQKFKSEDHKEHEDISAEFVESFLNRNQKIQKEIGKEIIKVVYDSVKNHHNTSVETIWLKEFREADFAARDKELKLIKRRVKGY